MNKEELEIENQRLKQLCSYYEEEHNNTFIMWARGIKERDIAEEKLEQIEQEINWIISTTNDELALARCKNILEIIKGDD